jgi:hypothetical protein
MEIFVDIKFNNRYEVGSYGTVRNKKTGAIVKPRLTRMGIEMLTLSSGTATYHYVRRLVAEHFISNPKKYECVAHIDGNRLNSRADNLIWCNMSYIKSFHKSKRFQIKIKGVNGLFRNVSDCAKFFNVSNDVIKKIIEGNEVHNSFNIEWNILTPKYP